MICRQRVASAVCTGTAVVRRKRQAVDDLCVPRHLWADRVAMDPKGWRDARFASSTNEHDWGSQMLGYLAFFDETIYLYRTALGLKPPMGCAQRYERTTPDSDLV
jgi:hypothetical protein